MSVLTGASPCDANFAAGGFGGGAVRPCCKPPSPRYAIYHFLIRLYETPFLLTILIFLYLTAAWMFFFRTLATAFPTSNVWKLSKNACSLNLVPSASFLTQSNWLKKKADQLLCIKKEALRTRLMPTTTMARC